ncbi:hypothetical protein Hanom_Chr13g01233321 [Helianthus anomalus]
MIGNGVCCTLSFGPPWPHIPIPSILLQPSCTTVATHLHPRHNSFIKHQTLNDNQIQPIQKIQIRVIAAAVHHYGISLNSGLSVSTLYLLLLPSLSLSVDRNLCVLFR